MNNNVQENPHESDKWDISETDQKIIKNAVELVQGFTTHDDDRRCMHFNALSGGCFKGGRCKLNHLVELGECRDQIKGYTKKFKDHPLPRVNYHYNIKITEFISPNRFFCHFKDVKEFYNGNDLQKLRDDLNDENRIKTYQKMKFIPGYGELVILRINSTYYRGKLLETINDKNNLTFLLVDEGKIMDVNFNNIYQYDSHFLDYPLFAIEMIVNDFVLDDALDGVKLLMYMQGDGYLSAYIVQHFPEICCILKCKGVNIKDILIDKGLAKYQDLTIIHNENNENDENYLHKKSVIPA